jgi:hypothetical protein
MFLTMFLAAFSPCLVFVLAMFRPCFGHAWAMFGPRFGHVLAMLGPSAHLITEVPNCTHLFVPLLPYYPLLKILGGELKIDRIKTVHDYFSKNYTNLKNKQIFLQVSI